MIGSIHLGVECDTGTVSLTGHELSRHECIAVDPDPSVASDFRISAVCHVGNRSDLKRYVSLFVSTTYRSGHKHGSLTNIAVIHVITAAAHDFLVARHRLALIV